MLSAIVENAGTNDERYTQVQSIDLHNHVHILKKQQSHAGLGEDDQIARTIEGLHNQVEPAIFNRPKDIPAWRIDVLCLDPAHNRVLICFAYSHCIGDGMSGSIFHDTFLAALNKKTEPVDAHFEIQKSVLPGLPYLPVSLSFLLAPALGHYLLRFIAEFFGFRASVSGSDDGTWVGAKHFDERLSPDRPIHAATEVFILDSETLSDVLKASRSHQTKLTALLNELIALCISRRLPHYHKSFDQKTNLVSCVPTNLRRVAGISKDMIGNFSGATYSRHPVMRTQELVVTDEVWLRARTQSANIANSVVSIKDQVVGLLGWISNMKTYMEGQLGHERDSSWQHSNLMAFAGGKNSDSDSITVERMYFCQPPDVVGQPISFNTISVKGRELVSCVVWQVGAIGLDGVQRVTVEERERSFVKEVLGDLKMCLGLALEKA